MLFYVALLCFLSVLQGFASAQNFGLSVDELVCAVNKFRASQGRPPLGYNVRVCNACLVHSQDMSTHRSMIHDGSDGSSPGVRMERQGLNCHGWAENIADGYNSVDDVMDAWINSPGHRKNLLGDYNVVCGARVGSYWTQDFAKLSDNEVTQARCNGNYGSHAPANTQSFYSPEQGNQGDEIPYESQEEPQSDWPEHYYRPESRRNVFTRYIRYLPHRSFYRPSYRRIFRTYHRRRPYIVHVAKTAEVEPEAGAEVHTPCTKTA